MDVSAFILFQIEGICSKELDGGKERRMQREYYIRFLQDTHAFRLVSAFSAACCSPSGIVVTDNGVLTPILLATLVRRLYSDGSDCTLLAVAARWSCPGAGAGVGPGTNVICAEPTGLATVATALVCVIGGEGLFTSTRPELACGDITVGRLDVVVMGTWA